MMFNKEQHYSLVTTDQLKSYPASFRDVWTVVSEQFSKPEANEYLRRSWTDQTPKSTRDRHRANKIKYHELSKEEYEKISVPIPYDDFVALQRKELAALEATALSPVAVS